MRVHGHAKRVLFFVITETPPGSGVFREDDGPLTLIGDRMQAVSACGEWLALDADVVGKGYGGVLVGSGAPDFAVRNDFSPYLAAADERFVIVDGYVRQADALRGGGMMADARTQHLRRLRAILELGLRAP